MLKVWLDELPFDYEDEDENGNIITKLDYPSDWEETDIKEHCQIMDIYLTKVWQMCYQLEIKKGE